MFEGVVVQCAGVILSKCCRHLGGKVHLLRVVSGAHSDLVFAHGGVLVVSTEDTGGRLGMYMWK